MLRGAVGGLSDEASNALKAEVDGRIGQYEAMGHGPAAARLEATRQTANALFGGKEKLSAADRRRRLELTRQITLLEREKDAEIGALKAEFHSKLQGEAIAALPDIIPMDATGPHLAKLNRDVESATSAPQIKAALEEFAANVVGEFEKNSNLSEALLKNKKTAAELTEDETNKLADRSAAQQISQEHGVPLPYVSSLIRAGDSPLAIVKEIRLAKGEPPPDLNRLYDEAQAVAAGRESVKLSVEEAKAAKQVARGGAMLVKELQSALDFAKDERAAALPQEVDEDGKPLPARSGASMKLTREEKIEAYRYALGKVAKDLPPETDIEAVKEAVVQVAHLTFRETYRFFRQFGYSEAQALRRADEEVREVHPYLYQE